MVPVEPIFNRKSSSVRPPYENRYEKISIFFWFLYGELCLWGIIHPMEMNRRHVVLKRVSDPDDDFVQASPAERVLMIWDLPSEIWSLSDPENVQRRLQRHVVSLTRQQG